MRFEDLVADYRNAAEHNDALFRQMEAATWADPLLSAHRRHVEARQLGFGDPAFHAMWASLLECAVRRFGSVNALEIGVFKGQVISLWAALAKARGWDLAIHAVTPLQGSPRPSSGLLARIRYRLDRRFRERADNGDFYAEEDYPAVVRAHFAHHGLDFGTVRLHRGLSTDPGILAELERETFHVIYVDGDHTYAGARHDFETFAPKVVPGGWLVADDASCDVPGTAFWKGHRAVSDAVKILDSLGFKNVLNVGHNRIFQKTG